MKWKLKEWSFSGDKEGEEDFEKERKKLFLITSFFSVGVGLLFRNSLKSIKKGLKKEIQLFIIFQSPHKISNKKKTFFFSLFFGPLFFWNS